MRFFGPYLSVIIAYALMILTTPAAAADVHGQSIDSMIAQSQSIYSVALSVTQPTGTPFLPSPPGCPPGGTDASGIPCSGDDSGQCHGRSCSSKDNPPIPATTSGEACIFDAPNGVSSGGRIGHVAWAFKVDDDRWVYGSTDGQDKTWAKTGSKHDMLQRFYSGAASVGYYTTYKCKKVNDAHMLFAYNRVVQSAANRYVPYYADCLTESVDIMKIYGLDDMADPLSRPLPNDYYNVNLPVGNGQWQGPMDLASS